MKNEEPKVISVGFATVPYSWRNRCWMLPGGRIVRSEKNAWYAAHRIDQCIRDLQTEKGV